MRDVAAPPETRLHSTQQPTRLLYGLLWCAEGPHIPPTTTHIGLRVHIGALLEQQRHDVRVTPLSRVVKGRVTTLHTGERGEESGRANMRWSRGVVGS